MLYHCCSFGLGLLGAQHFCSSDEDVGGKSLQCLFILPAAFVAALGICWFLFPRLSVCGMLLAFPHDHSAIVGLGLHALIFPLSFLLFPLPAFGCMLYVFVVFSFPLNIGLCTLDYSLG